MSRFLACLCVVASVGTALAQLGPAAKAKVEMARVEVANLTKAARAYKLKKGAFPAKLADQVKDGYVKLPEGKKELLDPWGRAYEYDPRGGRNDGKRPDIWATAPDKTEIGNWPAKPRGAGGSRRLNRTIQTVVAAGH